MGIMTDFGKKWTPPFRVGRKQKRSVLDSKGIELVVFPKGGEDYAKRFCEVLNQDFTISQKTEEIVKIWENQGLLDGLHSPPFTT